MSNPMKGWNKPVGVVWMRVSSDEYQLPEVVAGSRIELAWLCGVKPSTISSSMNEAKKGNRPHKYITVEVEDDA